MYLRNINIRPGFTFDAVYYIYSSTTHIANCICKLKGGIRFAVFGMEKKHPRSQTPVVVKYICIVESAQQQTGAYVHWIRNFLVYFRF